MNAQLLDYGRFRGYGLGVGFLGNDFTTALGACITGKEVALLASESGVRASITYSADEYKRAFHVDQNAEASFLGIARGSDELHLGMETGRSGSAFDIIIEAYGEHDSQTLNNVQWDPRYQAMLDSGDPAKVQRVRDTCGDRYIRTVFNETRLFAVLHVSNQQNSSLSTFKGSGKGSVSIDIVSASAALGGDVNISSAHKAGAISIDIHSVGLGVAPTATVIGIVAEDGLQGIATKLSKYLATLVDRGQPVKYLLAPLPDMPAAGLSDARVFEYLNELKSNYFAVLSRHNNVKSLGDRADARRIVLRQPEGDRTLAQQEQLLEAYLDKVSAAHEVCRKTLRIDPCIASAKRAGAPPQIESIELAPAGDSPFLGSFRFLVDGEPLPYGQTDLLLSRAGGSLLDAAKALVNASASSVDLIGHFGNDYVSLLNIDIYGPRTKPVGFYSIPGQQLTSPPNVETVPGTRSAFHILHSDKNHPCKIIRNNGETMVESTCLTAQGSVLKEVALAFGAQYVEDLLVRSVSLSPKFPIGDGTTISGRATTCFGQQFTVPLVGFRIAASPDSGGKIKSQVQINVRIGDVPQNVAPNSGSSFPQPSFVPWPLMFPAASQGTGGIGSAMPQVFPADQFPSFMAMPYFVLTMQEESNDPVAWRTLAKNRQTQTGKTGVGVNPCGPHIP